MPLSRAWSSARSKSPTPCAVRASGACFCSWLLIFVAIPLPGTGAWTGSLIAAMLEMRVREAFPPIALGVVTAGIIVAVVTYGAASLLF